MLTTRYKIPIENISFEHISELKATKESERELEKMIKILESGELGHFPQLLDHARDKLKQMNRHHRLVKEPPALINKLQTLERDHAEQLRTELDDWVKEIKITETQVENTRKPQHKSTTGGGDSTDNFNIRGSIGSNSQAINTSKRFRIKSCDYVAWDKFDPDVEMKKMDVDIEREKTRIKRQEQAKKEKTDEKEYYTPQEKVRYAEDLRMKGNHSYKTGKYLEAITLYTESILLYPTAISYSNRAQVHIKLSKCKDAIKDCDMALSIDPYFVKAIYRKALALYNLKKFEESVVWFQKFLNEEPNNKSAHDYLSKLHNIVPVKLLEKQNKTMDGTHTNQKQQTPKIVLLEEETTRTTQNMKENNNKNKTQTAQRNEWGFLKKQPIPRGQPEFMKQYDTEKRNGNQNKSAIYNKSSSHWGNTQMIHKSNINATSKANDDTQNPQGKTLRAITERHSQFLDTPEHYQPKAVVDMFGTNSYKKSGDGVTSHIELVPRTNKGRTSQRPKIEVLKSVDFDN